MHGWRWIDRGQRRPRSGQTFQNTVQSSQYRWGRRSRGLSARFHGIFFFWKICWFLFVQQREVEVLPAAFDANIYDTQTAVRSGVVRGLDIAARICRRGQTLRYGCVFGVAFSVQKNEGKKLTRCQCNSVHRGNDVVTPSNHCYDR